MRKLAFVIALAGCGFDHGKATGDGGGSGSDAKIFLDGSDGNVQIDARGCFGAAGYAVCLDGAQLPTGPYTLPMTLATDGPDCLMTQPTDWASAGQPDTCFIVGTSISSAAGKTVVTGPRPLVLLATDTIDLTQGLDVASHQAGGDGPGANPLVCGRYMTAPGNSSNGGGGGAGGGFVLPGGAGGQGNNATTSAGPALTALGAPTSLQGGCPGQRGGDGSSLNNGGSGASGGGAVYLVAGNSITLSDLSINASGAGSSHGGHASGGGGGGSGGMIVLWAPMISTTTVTLVANGGGGSSGGDSNMAGHNGMDGSDPDPMMPMLAAGGGTGPGGAGGAGYAGSATKGGVGVGGGNNEGGGGGGGGAGYIQSKIALSAVTSPAISVVP